MPGRFLVGAGGGDENELIRLAAKETQVAFDVGGGEREKVHYRVETASRYEVRKKRFVGVEVGAQESRARGEGVLGRVAAVQQKEFVAALEGEFGAGGTDQSRAANEEEFH
jgi:hypothetical protein